LQLVNLKLLELLIYFQIAKPYIIFLNPLYSLTGNFINCCI